MKDALHTEIEWFTFFEITPDLVCIADKDGFFKKINPAVIKTLGYTEAELFASPISSFIHPDDKGHTHERRAKLLGGEALVNFENRYVTKDGKDVWLQWTSIYFSGGEIVFAIAKDITVRKLREIATEEKYKKFESLASHFKTSSENDRKYFAYELQEELAQLAAAVKMDVDWLAGNEPGLQGPSKTRVEHALTASELLLKTIQRISFSISPKMLEDFGLNATLEWLCKEFSILNKIPCSFESAYDEESLSHEMKIDFFRICQESLTNVIAHAQAKNVKISIREAHDKIQLTIIDNGKGFDVNREKHGPGLINIRERVASINGALALQSQPGAGTEVCVTVERP
jgi:PAS domain S-box-containing protein